MIKYPLIFLTLFNLLINSTIGKHGKIVGKVIIADTSVPIVGAQLMLDSLSITYSDHKGCFEFNEVMPGSRTITIIAQHYCPIIRYNIRVLPDFVARCDFKLSITDTCSLPIVDLNERPLLKRDSIMDLFRNINDYERYKKLMDSLGFKERNW